MFSRRSFPRQVLSSGSSEVEEPVLMVDSLEELMFRLTDQPFISGICLLARLTSQKMELAGLTQVGTRQQVVLPASHSWLNTYLQ
jgi:hypothetical protein